MRDEVLLIGSCCADLESAGAVCWIKDLGSRNKVHTALAVLTMQELIFAKDLV